MDLAGMIEEALAGQFYRYSGSLTTPTRDESVVWTNFQLPLTIGPDQVKKL